MRRFLFLMVFFLSSLSLAAGFDVTEAEFGVFDAKNPKRLGFEAAQVIPRKAGLRYGWMIVLKNAPPNVSVREEYLIAPKNRTDNTEGLVVFDRRQQVSQRYLAPKDGVIVGEWEMGPSDPKGPRHLQVIIDDRAIVDFEFEVQ